MAGKRLGKEDERHLWPEMLRAIREIAPRYVVGENVLGLTNWNGGLVFDEVHSDLESAGYEVQAVVIPAAAVNAPHGRDRVWFVAHNASAGLGRSAGTGLQRGSRGLANKGNERLASDTDSARVQGQPVNTGTMQKIRQRGKGFKEIRNNGHFANWENFPTQSPICGGDDGLPTELDGITFSKWRNESIKAYGNAVVPQVVFQIFKAIAEIDVNL
jgi:DNA (cytosine-5)-methyltransferase 1